MSRNPVCFALFFALPIGVAHAQFNSVIQGTAIDSSGGLVPGATVRATNTATGIVRQAITSREGIYFLVSLAPGKYQVSAEKPGFATARQEGVELAGSETIKVDLVLQVGSSTATVTVAEHAALVETEEGRVSGRIDSLQLNEMPLNGGNVYTLLALQPGIIGTGIMGSSALGGSDSFTAAGTPGVYASGQRLDSNGYSVDNTSVDSTSGGGVTYLSPNPESVEEIRVVANNFSAAEGRTASAQIRVITKSGSNEFHGGASYYFENNTLSSRNEFATMAASLPVFRRNEFGAHFGGPIIRNRTFFFGSYEGLRSSGARGASEVVETAAFRNFVETTEPNSIAAHVLRVYQPIVDPTYNFKTVVPNPGPGVTPIIPTGMLDIGTANYVPYAFRNGNQYNARIDHELRPGKDRLYGSIYRTPSRSVTGDIRPADNRPTSQASDFASVNYTHIFSPRLINEFRAGVARTISNQDLPPHPDVPSLTITGISSVISQNFFPSKYAQTG